MASMTYLHIWSLLLHLFAYLMQLVLYFAIICMLNCNRSSFVDLFAYYIFHLNFFPAVIYIPNCKWFFCAYICTLIVTRLLSCKCSYKELQLVFYVLICILNWNWSTFLQLSAYRIEFLVCILFSYYIETGLYCNYLHSELWLVEIIIISNFTS